MWIVSDRSPFRLLPPRVGVLSVIACLRHLRNQRSSAGRLSAGNIPFSRTELLDALLRGGISLIVPSWLVRAEKARSFQLRAVVVVGKAPRHLGNLLQTEYFWTLL
jgi:hypothetical protein